MSTDQPVPSFPTSPGTSEGTSITLLGQDLATDLMGHVSFGDPRTLRIIGIAREEGLYGPHLALFEAIGRMHPEVLGKRLPLNGAGVSGAALADLGLPLELLRGVVLLARCAGLLGHIAEEIRRPVASSIYMTVDRNAVYIPPNGTGTAGT